MGPKKTNRSPFALFMTKMIIEDNSIQKKSHKERFKYCDQFYKKIGSKQKAMFEALSLTVRLKGLKDEEVFQLIKHSFNLRDNSLNNTSDNRSIEPIVEKNDENKENEEVWDDYQKVKSGLDLYGNDVKNISFIVISFNVLVKTIDGKYIPNEIGLTKFSLEDGVQQTYHRLIANPIPSGYYGSAQDLSQSTHRIPLYSIDNHLFAQNYELIREEVYAFLYSSQLIETKNQKKLIFCKLDNNFEQKRRADRDQVYGCVEWLNNYKRNDWSKGFSVFEFIDLTELLYALTHPLTKKSKNVMSAELSYFPFDFCPKTNCDFHEEIERRFCALGVSQRMVYLFFRSCLHLFAIKCKPSHKPKHVEVEPPVITKFQFY